MDHQELLREGRVQEALAAAEARLQQGEDPQALLTLARVKVAQGELEQAASLLDRAEKTGPTVDSLIVRATLCSVTNDDERAYDLYAQALKLRPTRADGWFGVGLLALKLDQPKPAAGHLREAVALAPEVAVYRFHLAEALFALEQVEAATEQLAKVTELQPGFVPAWLVWAALLQEIGKLGEAIDLILGALDILPDEPDLLSRLSSLLVAADDLPLALRASEKLLAQVGEHPAALAEHARLLMAAGRLDEALALCRKLEAQGQASAGSKRVEACVLEAFEVPDEEGAAAAWEAAAALDPSDWTAPNNLGLLLLQKGDEARPRALAAFEEAMTRAPRQAEPRFNLALALAEQEAFRPRARSLLSGLVEELPEGELQQRARRLLEALGPPG
jgi:tetratricopeptide (TPR) repeat protein